MAQWLSQIVLFACLAFTACSSAEQETEVSASVVSMDPGAQKLGTLVANHPAFKAFQDFLYQQEAGCLFNAEKLYTDALAMVDDQDALILIRPGECPDGRELNLVVRGPKSDEGAADFALGASIAQKSEDGSTTHRYHMVILGKEGTQIVSGTGRFLATFDDLAAQNTGSVSSGETASAQVAGMAAATPLGFSWCGPALAGSGLVVGAAATTAILGAIATGTAANAALAASYPPGIKLDKDYVGLFEKAFRRFGGRAGALAPIAIAGTLVAGALLVGAVSLCGEISDYSRTLNTCEPLSMCYGSSLFCNNRYVLNRGCEARAFNDQTKQRLDAAQANQAADVVTRSDDLNKRFLNLAKSSNVKFVTPSLPGFGSITNPPGT